jgi:hypothetical protein
MDFTLIVLGSTAMLFAGMLMFAELGRRLGVAKLARDPAGLGTGVGAAESAVFGLLALLIAFTFSGAASRLEDRRHLVSDEANAIGTAYLRIDVLPTDAQPEMRNLFRRYVDNRVATYRNAEDFAGTTALLAEGGALQGDIWKQASAAVQRPGTSTVAAMLMLPALNDMIDITTTRATATRNHPPAIIFLLLGGLSLLAALLVGYATSANKQRSWFHTLIFSAMLSLTVYVIVDIEFPRAGLIRVDAADQALIELRKSMQ